MPVGDPLDPSTVIGPLVSAAQRNRVEGYIELGKSEGAKLALGGGRPKGLDRGVHDDQVDSAPGLRSPSIGLHCSGDER